MATASDRPLPMISVPNAIELFVNRVEQSSQRVALRWKSGAVWQQATYADWDRTAREIAGGLLALGTQPGDRICLLANTRPEWLYSDVGIVMCGAATVPIYQSNLSSECEYIVNDAGATLIFVENPLQLEKIVAERSKLPGLRKVIAFDQVARLEKPDGKGRIEVRQSDVHAEGDDWVWTLDQLREAGRKLLGEQPDALQKRQAATTPESIFTIVYTSGTTGPPKGAVLTHRNLVWEADAMRNVLPLDEDDEQLLFLPMAHIFAKVMAWTSIVKGCRIAFAESVAKVRDNLAEVRPTFLGSVPRVLEKVYIAILANRAAQPPTKQKLFDWAFSVGAKVGRLKQRGEPIPLLLRASYEIADRLVLQKVRGILGGRIRFVISGGAPLSAKIAEFFHAAGVLVLEAWGLTETTAGTTINRVDRYDFGVVGQAVPGTELRIAADGEILVRSGAVMREYWRKPEATAEAIDADGWFHTGDIGVLDDGVLRITDRKKDIIVNAGGKNIAPQNLENKLKATPFISQAMVVGDRRPYLVALITLNEEAVQKWAAQGGFGGKTIAELSQLPETRQLIGRAVDEVNRSEPSYASIKKFHILPQDFSQETGELTPTLKVRRKAASEKYAAILEQLYGKGGEG